MFVDIIGASEVSNHLSVVRYKEFVQEFKDIFRSACRSYLDNWLDDLKEIDDYQFSAKGDEGLLLIYPEGDAQKTSLLIDIAINIALELKRSWLLSKRNRENVRSGIVPIDIAVGIHIGQTCLAEDFEGEKPVKRPEGYAINLAKRIEGFSRTGQYSHIFVSEAAHGLLNRLADEKTYLFDEPKSQLVKGFSREIRAFEVMHHFLPTDWTVGVEEPDAMSSSKALLRVPSEGNLGICMKALQLNPTNIWLAEECIRASMLFAFNALAEAERENQQKLRDAYDQAMEIVSYLSQGDQRDPGILMIKGLIHGESFDFDQERLCYREARALNRQVPVLAWYEGYSLSSEVWYEIDGDNLTDDEKRKLTPHTIVPKRQLSADEIRKKITEAIRLLAEAAEVARWAAWIHYTYGCELVMWGNDAQREEGISEVSFACKLLDDVKLEISREYYLMKVWDDPRMKSLQK